MSSSVLKTRKHQRMKIKFSGIVEGMVDSS